MSPQTIVENECCGVCGGQTVESINGRKERKVEWGDILLIECSDARGAAHIAYANSGLRQTADKRQWKKRKASNCGQASMGEKEECSDVVRLSSPVSSPVSRTQIDHERPFGFLRGNGCWSDGLQFRSSGYREIAGASTGPDLAEAASSPGLSASGSVCGNTDNGGEKPSERPPQYGGTNGGTRRSVGWE
ncbi:hypothetical protein EDB86DRAFT_2832927 [Lactarius hatsudake]|nr:hypothetical protein EDB86DRAFT_2832927 [Lactarius hatsudake]